MTALVIMATVFVFMFGWVVGFIAGRGHEEREFWRAMAAVSQTSVSQPFPELKVPTRAFEKVH